MAKTGSFIHRVLKEPLVDFGTSFDAAKKILINLTASGTYTTSKYKNLPTTRAWGGSLQIIRVSGTEISGAVGTVTLSGYADAAGTELLIEPTQAVAIETMDHSSSNRICSVFLVDAYINLPNDELYLFVKVGANTLRVDKIYVSWVE
jgi:formylmethanofuran dehydrogenase subunit E-like metal-binding protein|tara:strand:+ start:745 stop:1188 length:444 start_codon:yes stop_codon:yes gene_type:complete